MPPDFSQVAAARTRKERLVFYILATLFAIVLLSAVVTMLVHEASGSL